MLVLLTQIEIGGGCCFNHVTNYCIIEGWVSCIAVQYIRLQSTVQCVPVRLVLVNTLVLVNNDIISNVI